MQDAYTNVGPLEEASCTYTAQIFSDQPFRLDVKTLSGSCQVKGNKIDSLHFWDLECQIASLL